MNLNLTLFCCSILIFSDCCRRRRHQFVGMFFLLYVIVTFRSSFFAIQNLFLFCFQFFFTFSHYVLFIIISDSKIRKKLFAKLLHKIINNCYTIIRPQLITKFLLLFSNVECCCKLVYVCCNKQIWECC